MTALVAIGVALVMATTPAATPTPNPNPNNKDAAAAAAPVPAKGETAKPSTAKSSTTKPAAAGKLAPEIAKEMADAIIAINKSLGLESWPAHGVKPCIDRGGQGILAKDVTPEDARKCATAAVEKGLPELGKSYVVAILVGAIGPVTVIALGTGEQAGWGAYSCDPTRACKPMKINPGNKWGKRLDERRTKACGDAATIWLPAGQKACSSEGK